MLQLNNISWQSPDGKGILNDISLNIPEGRLVVITGPNGGGKTTLAKVIAGIEQPSAGHIILNNEDITNLNVTERAKKGISFAFQQPVRFKGITVRQLIEIASGSNLPEPKLCEILATVGLCAKSYINREVNSSLSGGEIKRIEIATVLARHTTLSLFDEPEAGIDLWSFKNLIDVFQNMKKNLKGTLVIISHQERILEIADSIILLSEGKIKSSGECQKMLKKIVCTESNTKYCCGREDN